MLQKHFTLVHVVLYVDLGLLFVNIFVFCSFSLRRWHFAFAFVIGLATTASPLLLGLASRYDVNEDSVLSHSGLS